MLLKARISFGATVPFEAIGFWSRLVTLDYAPLLQRLSANVDSAFSDITQWHVTLPSLSSWVMPSTGVTYCEIQGNLLQCDAWVGQSYCPLLLRLTTNRRQQGALQGLAHNLAALCMYLCEPIPHTLCLATSVVTDRCRWVCSQVRFEQELEIIMESPVRGFLHDGVEGEEEALLASRRWRWFIAEPYR